MKLVRSTSSFTSKALTSPSWMQPLSSESVSQPAMAGMVQSSRWLPVTFSMRIRPLSTLTDLPPILNVVPSGKLLTSTVPDHAPDVLAPLDE